MNQALSDQSVVNQIVDSHNAGLELRDASRTPWAAEGSFRLAYGFALNENQPALAVQLLSDSAVMHSRRVAIDGAPSKLLLDQMLATVKLMADHVQTHSLQNTKAEALMLYCSGLHAFLNDDARRNQAEPQQNIYLAAAIRFSAAVKILTGLNDEEGASEYPLIVSWLGYANAACGKSSHSHQDRLYCVGARRKLDEAYRLLEPSKLVGSPTDDLRVKEQPSRYCQDLQMWLNLASGYALLGDTARRITCTDQAYMLADMLTKEFANPWPMAAFLYHGMQSMPSLASAN